MRYPWLAGVIIVSTMPPTGMMAPDVIVSSVCTSGYAHRERAAYAPPSVTDPIKEDSCAVLFDNQTDQVGCIKGHELDHYFPIEAGGCPDCPDNLWLQEWPEAKKKDQVENYVHSLLCTGKIDLDQVPDYIGNWEQIYEQIKSDQ